MYVMQTVNVTVIAYVVLSKRENVPSFGKQQIAASIDGYETMVEAYTTMPSKLNVDFPVLNQPSVCACVTNVAIDDNDGTLTHTTIK